MANIRVKQAADYVGLSKSTLDKFRIFGGGPTFCKLGRSVIYRTDDLDIWMQARARTSTWGDNDNKRAAARSAA